MEPEFIAWVGMQLNDSCIKFSKVNADASSRKYWRAHSKNGDYIACISPPNSENNQAFIDVGNSLKQLSLQVPEILAYLPEKGYFLLSDFGRKLYYPYLTQVDKKPHLEQAVLALINMQSILINTELNLPNFDDKLISDELSYCKQYFFKEMLDIKMPAHILKLWDNIFVCICNTFTEQPTVFVHRDYHFCNLFVLDKNSPGIIDYQDAVYGPITYDLVSLLRDRSPIVTDSELYSYLKTYASLYEKYGKIAIPEFTTFKRWFDITAIQRHLKVVGIFARLHICAQKSDYLKFIPTFLRYIQFFMNQYPEFLPFAQWLASDVHSKFNTELTIRQISE